MQDNDFHVRQDPERLAAYADGRLDASARANVTAHLVRCAECRAQLALLARGLGDTGGSVGAGAFRVWMPIAASLVVAAVGAGLYLRPRPATPPTPAVSAPAVPRPPTTSPPVSTVPGPAVAAPAAGADPTRSVSTRRVAGKTFHLVAGEWIDESYDPLAALPVTAIGTPVEKDAAVSRTPSLRPYTALGRRFTVVVAGTVYRVDIR